jgi:hypothetical protein
MKSESIKGGLNIQYWSNKFPKLKKFLLVKKQIDVTKPKNKWNNYEKSQCSVIGLYFNFFVSIQIVFKDTLFLNTQIEDFLKVELLNLYLKQIKKSFTSPHTIKKKI